MNFTNLRKNIKECKECGFKDNHSPPLYFNCTEPEKIHCLIITEQPKEREGNSLTENSLKEDLKQSGTSTTRQWLIKTFSEPSFKDGIINETGPYYWTHHTKCPSGKREIKKKCPAKWFKEELLSFPNLKIIISLGTESFRGVADISDNFKKVDFYEYFWKEVETTVKEEFKKSGVMLRFNNKDILYLALPHPSRKNPLSNLLPKLDPIINWFKKEGDLI